jgi:hypothetical protein
VHEELKRERGHYKSLCTELRASLKHSDTRWEARACCVCVCGQAWLDSTIGRANLNEQANRSIVQDAQDRLLRLQEQVRHPTPTNRPLATLGIAGCARGPGQPRSPVIDIRSFRGRSRTAWCVAATQSGGGEREASHIRAGRPPVSLSPPHTNKQTKRNQTTRGNPFGHSPLVLARRLTQRLAVQAEAAEAALRTLRVRVEV